MRTATPPERQLERNGECAEKVEGFCCPVPSEPRLTLLGARTWV